MPEEMGGDTRQIVRRVKVKNLPESMTASVPSRTARGKGRQSALSNKYIMIRLLDAGSANHRRLNKEYGVYLSDSY